MKYTYTIRKRKSTEALHGYGYELIMYKGKRETYRAAAFATRSMAKAHAEFIIEGR